MGGFAGYMKILSGNFSINGSRVLLISKHNDIDLGYIKFVLEPILRESAIGRKGDKQSSEFTRLNMSILKYYIYQNPNPSKWSI